METLTYQVGVSQLTLSEEGLSITIPRQHWTPRQWSWLVTWLTQALAAGLKWVTVPVTIAATASRSGQPLRWKQMVMDGLSYLLFVLLIPAHHPLRSASDLSDSGVDVRQRHTLRERDTLWPPPDAGALGRFRKRLKNWSAPTARGWSVWVARTRKARSGIGRQRDCSVT